MIVKTSALAALTLAAFSSASFAGFVATTGLTGDTVHNNDVAGGPGADVGDSFDIVDGTFGTYIPTTTGPGANDPQIQGDLPSFGYTLHGDVASVAGNVVSYTGNYRIFYDLNGNNTYENTDTSVSFGSFTGTATFTGFTAIVGGSLTQTQGPTGPAAGNFADLGARYNYNPVTVNGTYATDPLNPAVGTMASILTQSATAVPEPTTLAALAGVGAIGLRRRRA